ncbi:MAG: Uma2 family endonuclease [Prochlorothrix sp.]|nr:Uma2 family endonuclease [Prochlorothrix sp.]
MIAPISTPTVPQTTDTDPPIAPVLSQSLPPADEVFYPDSDGQPMADNTKQFRWITVIQYNLSWLFAQDPAVFVAGDLLWYPVQGNNKLRQAPDVMVVFGVPKGDRGSYQQWKENDIAPQVVFEILSPGNTLAEMTRKLAFYSRYGVEEYYIYDPDRDELTGCLQRDGALEVIEEMVGWVSPRLGITFKGLDPDLQLLRPDGTAFTSYEAVSQQLEETSQQLEAASQQLEAASQQLEATSQQLEAERDRADRLAAQLRALGIDPT